MCFELAPTNLLRSLQLASSCGRLSRGDCGESGSTAGSERATRAYGIGPSGSGIVPIGLAVGATGFLRERSGRTPTRPVHRAIIRSFFWFSVSPFLLGRVKRRYWHLKAQSMRLTRGLRGGGSLSLLSCSCSPSTGLRSWHRRISRALDRSGADDPDADYRLRVRSRQHFSFAFFNGSSTSPSR